MLKKRNIVLPVLLLFNFNFLTAQDSIIEKPDYSLLWKIEGSRIEKASYLFGTMHVRDKKVFEFSDSVIVSLLKSEVLALELNLDTARYQILKKAIEKAEQNAYKTVFYSEEDMDLIKERLKEYGINSEDITAKTPEELDYLLNDIEDSKGDKMPLFLDAYLYRKAISEGKTIVGLESYEDQISNDSIGDKYKEILDKYKNIQLITDMKNQLIEIYNRGNINEIWNFPGIINDTAELNLRNEKMARGLDSLMQSNSVFCAVGVAHLPGKDGLIQLLSNKGYTLSKVEASFTGISDKLIPYDPPRPYQNIDSISGFSLQTPFKPFVFNIFGGLFEMKICQDFIYAPTYYFYSIPASYIGVAGESQDISKLFIENLTKNDNYKILSQTPIVYKGTQGVELILSKDRNSSKLRFFYLNNFIYVLMVGFNETHYESDEANNFFESLVLFEPKKPIETIKEWEKYTDEIGAFSVYFPKKPSYQTAVIPDNTDSTAVWTLHIHSCINNSNQEVYILRWNDLPAGYYFKNDSNTVTELLREIYGDTFVFDNHLIQQIDREGCFYYEPAKPLIDKGMQLRCRIYLRGNRLYLLLAQIKEGSELLVTNPFFDHFIPEEFKKTAYSEYNVDGLMIKLPEKPIHTSSDDGSPFYSDGIKSDTYSSRDPNTGNSINIVIYRYPKYYRFENIDSLYTSYYKTLLEGDTYITDSSYYSCGHIRINTGMILTKKTTNKTRYYNMLADDKYFQIYLYGNDDIINDSLYHNLLSETTITYENAEFDLFGGKAELLFSDLKSNDSIIFNNAKQALQYYIFTPNEADVLHQMLYTNYPDSADIWNTVKENILSALGTAYNENTEHILKEFYISNHDTGLSGNILSSYIDVCDNEPEKTYDLMSLYPPSNLDYYSADKILSTISDSLEFYKTILPSFINLMEDEIQMKQILITNLVDSFEILNIPDFKESIFPKFINWYKDALDSLKSNPDYSYDYEEILYQFTKLMTKLNDPKLDTYVYALKDLNNNYINASVIVYMAKRGLNIKGKLWQTVLQDNYSGYDVIYLLNDSKLLNCLPEKYNTVEYINLKSVLYDLYLEEEESIHFDIREIKKIALTKDNRTHDYFIYEYNYEGETEKYLIFAGGIEKDSDKLNFDQFIIDYSYGEIITEEDRLRGIDELIQRNK